MMKAKRFYPLAFLLGISLTINCQSILTAFRLNHQITIDGNVSEAEWQMVPVLKVTQKVPDAGAPPTQLTEIRIAYDHDNLYLSGRLYDEEVDKIIANTKKRDDFTENTEWVGLLIDSYNDRKNALAFFITPNGTKLDMSLANDIQGPNAFNTAWNSDWESAAVQNEDGWFAELRIPFSSLAFQQDEKKTIMGITTFRYLARNDETDIFPGRDLASGSTFRPSLTQRFEFFDISEKKKIQITPFLLGGLSRSSHSNKSLDRSSLEHKLEFGLDVRLPIGNKVHIDLTYNTDFAQVEADDQQVNLTRSSIFFPERRLFFQESASLFDFNFGGNDRLFHSRNIGIRNGTQVSINGGIKAFSQNGTWDNGLIAMQTADNPESSKEDFIIYRMKHRILNDQSNLGFMITYRGNESESGYALGIDSDLHLGKSVFLNSRLAYSRKKGGRIFNGSKYYLEFVKRSQDGWTYNFNLGGATADYQTLLGFQSRNNFFESNASLAFNMFPGKSSKTVQHGPFISNNNILEHSSGDLISMYNGIGYNVATKIGYTFSLSYNQTLEKITSPIQFTERIIIDAGKVNFSNINFNLNTPTAGNFSYALNASLGSFYSGKKYSLMLQPTVNINPDWSLSPSYQYNYIEMPKNMNTTVSEHLHLLKVISLYTLSTKLSINVNVQYNHQAAQVFSGIRMRYNPTEGTDLYIVYNSQDDIIEKRYEELMSKQKYQTLLIKFSHTFRVY